MKFFPFILFVVFTIFLLTSCGGCFKSKTITKHRRVTDTLVVDLPLSVFNIPVTYELKDFEIWINQVIKGDFFETIINPLSDDRDEAKLILTKKKLIQVRSSGNELICIIPLEAEVVLIKSRLGKMLTSAAKPMITTVNIELSTSVSLDKNWNLVTAFKIKRANWDIEPVFQMGPFKKNLKDEINKWLWANDQKLARQLDNEINKTVSMKSAVEKIWKDLQKPIIIRKKTPGVWLQFSCFSLEGKIELGTTNITCKTKVKANTKIITDITLAAAVTNLPNYQFLKESSSVSDVHLYAFTSFAEINEQLNTQLKGKRFTAQGYTMELKHFDAYASDSGFAMEVTTRKDIKGKFIATGKLEFDSVAQTLQIRNFDYSFNSNNTLVNAGDLLLHEQVRDTIATYLTLKMSALINSIPELVEQAIATGKSKDQVELYFDELTINHCHISMGALGVHFIIHAEATAGIHIKKINPGKRMNVEK